MIAIRSEAGRAGCVENDDKYVRQLGWGLRFVIGVKNDLSGP